MSYSHVFYGLNLNKLQSIYGSKDDTLVAEVSQAQAAKLKDNDGFFEDQIEQGNFPTSETALREIVAGSFGQYEHAEAMYGYVLKILCEHFGTPFGQDVAAVGDHSYKSQLVASGPPIPIPHDKSDFPEIGFLSLAEIPKEIKRIEAAPKRAKRLLVRTLLHWLTRGMIRPQMSNKEAVEDMNAYRKTLKEALDRKFSVVSFRH